MQEGGESPSGFKYGVAVVALLLLALSLRLYGIATESFWTDEALTVDRSNGTVAEVIRTNARQMLPPLYNVGLRLWRDALGDSDARIRAFSTLWSLIGLVGLFLLARELAGRRAALIALILAAVNPLDIYFAQEARNYAQMAAVCTLSSWCLWRWVTVSAEPRDGSRWWGWALAYTACAAAALLTHYLAALILAAQGLFALAVFVSRRQWTRVAGSAASTLAVIVSFLPWLFYVRSVRLSFGDTPDWMKLPPASDYFSFLGREFFWGYVWKVHDRWWWPTMILPAFVLGICLWRLWPRRSTDFAALREPQPLGIAYGVWLLAAPVLLAALASLLYRPIYYRPRFSLLVLPPFLALAAIAFASLRHRAAAGLGMAALGAMMLAGTAVQQQTIQKMDWRGFARVWREQGPPAQVVFFPWYFEKPAGYYLKGLPAPATRESLEKTLAPLRGQEIWICAEKGYDFKRIGEADFYRWLTALGRPRSIPMATELHLQAVKVGDESVPEPYRGRFGQWYEPMDRPGRIEGFGDGARFNALEFDQNQAAFRWSLPRAWLRIDGSDRATTVVLNIAMPSAVAPNYRPDLKFYAIRGGEASALFDSPPVAQIANQRAGTFEAALRVPQGSGPLWIGWTLNGINPKRAGVSLDDRELGLKVNWVGLENDHN